MVAKWGRRMRRKKSTRDLKKEGSKWGWINSKGRSSWHPWKHLVFSPLESCDEFGNGVVSLLGCWGGGKVLKGAKWKASESSAEQWCKLLLFSKLFTSSLWFQHQQWPPCAAFTPPSLSLSLSLSAPSILSPFSFMFSLPSSPPAFASLPPSTSPRIALIYSLAIHPARSQKSSLCIYLHDVGKKNTELGALGRWVWGA